VTRLNELRAQLVIAISSEQTAEVAASAAALDAETGNLEDALPLDAFVDKSALAAEARTAADAAAATVARIEVKIVCTKTEIANLGVSRRTRYTSNSHAAMKEVLRDLIKDSTAQINPATALLLGKPSAPNKMQRPSAANLSR
jgi:hypothetical protein